MAKSASPEGWDNVKNRLNARLLELGWDQAELVRRSGVSDTTIRQLQTASATSYRPSTLAKVEAAVGWTHGSIDEIRRGEEPSLLERPEIHGGHGGIDWSAVADFVRRRRSQIFGHTIPAMARLASVPLDVWESLERGDRDRYEIRDLARVADALDMSSDALLRVGLGGEPLEGSPEQILVIEARVSGLEYKVDRVVDQLSQLVQQIRELRADLEASE